MPKASAWTHIIPQSVFRKSYLVQRDPWPSWMRRRPWITAVFVSPAIDTTLALVVSNKLACHCVQIESAMHGAGERAVAADQLEHGKPDRHFPQVPFDRLCWQDANR